MNTLLFVKKKIRNWSKLVIPCWKENNWIVFEKLRSIIDIFKFSHPFLKRCQTLGWTLGMLICIQLIKKVGHLLLKKNRKKSLEHAFGFGSRYIHIRIQKFWDPNPDLYAFLSKDLNIEFTISTRRTKKIVWSKGSGQAWPRFALTLPSHMRVEPRLGQSSPWAFTS